METHIILVVGSILLSGGCIGLLIVRFTNPFFQGVGWLGASFACGALGAAVFTLRFGQEGNLTLPLAYSLVLLALILLHVCFLEITESKVHLSRLGTVVFLLQALAFFVFRHSRNIQEVSIVVFGVAVAAQVTQSAWQLKKTNQEGMDAPAWFNVTLLIALGTFSLARSLIVLLVGTPTNPQLPNPLEAITAVVFLGAAIGLGFGVFWMEGHQIRLKLEHLASIDPLTGIYNRRSFIALCEQELLRTSRSGEVFSLIMFDLDHFKAINDRHGHRFGDVVLCEVVEKLRNSVRNIDIVGRWGGEEFVVLLPSADAEAALIVAHRLQYHVDSISMASPRAHGREGENRIAVTLSIGVATYFGHDPTITIHDLLHECDSAMYQAKAEGRDRIVSVNAPLALVR
ncbi:MAG: GGDEF domain-containing protein [Acidobacteriaceae bacterium]